MPHLITPLTKNDHFQGPTNATFLLVEYGDYQCPYCRMAYPVVKKIQKALKEDLCFAYRNFPLKEMHPMATMAAQAAEAAALQNKFWEVHDLLFENQPLLGSELISEIADELNLNKNRFAKDMDSPEVLKKIETDFINGVRSGVNGTPCFFINGERYNGNPTFKDLMEFMNKNSA